MKREHTRWAEFASLAAALFASVISIFLSLVEWESKTPVIVSVVILGLLGASVSAYYILASGSRYPSSLVVSLVGPPGVGKTTYLTMLFRELERGEVGPLIFAPAGRATTELVARHIHRLSSGYFPEPTPSGPPIFYEAVARIGRLFQRQYRIRIADFAGEYLERASQDDPWFHNSEFFDVLVKSDAIFFMIDCDTVEGPSPPGNNRVAALERSFIAALNLIIERRNEVDPTARLDIPVALLFSKADAIWEYPDADRKQLLALKEMEDLIAICMRRCKRFQYFFLSSLGRRPEPGNTPPRLCSPKGIVEPIIWLLRR